MKEITHISVFSSYSLIYSKYVSMTTRKYVHIPEISSSNLGLPTDGVYPTKKSDIFIDCNCAKRGLEKQDFFPKNNQLCCVMMTKHIFSVLYMHYISYFYMVIIHLYVVLLMLEEIYAISGMMFIVYNDLFACPNECR